MHMEANLLDSMGDVWARKCQVLESVGRLRYNVGLVIGGPAADESLEFVSIGVDTGLQLAMPAR